MGNGNKLNLINPLEREYPQIWNSLLELGFRNEATERMNKNGTLVLKNPILINYPSGLTVQTESGYVRDTSVRSGFLKKFSGEDKIQKIYEYLIYLFNKSKKIYDRMEKDVEETSFELEKMLSLSSRKGFTINKVKKEIIFNSDLYLTDTEPLYYIRDNGYRIGEVKGSFILNGNTANIDELNIELYNMLPKKASFIRLLDFKKISKKLKNIDLNSSFGIDVTHLEKGMIFSNDGDVQLNSLTSIPVNVEFNNKGNVYLPYTVSISGKVDFNNQDGVYISKIKSIGNNVRFRNGGSLNVSVESIPNDFEFNNGGIIYLDRLKSLPNNVEFNNEGDLFISNLQSMGDNVQFNNGGNVSLYRIKSIPDNVKFNNGGDVYLLNLESIPDESRFNNKCYINLSSLKSIPIDLDLLGDLRGESKIEIRKDLGSGPEFTHSRWKRVDERVQMYESWVKNNY